MRAGRRLTAVPEHEAGRAPRPAGRRVPGDTDDKAPAAHGLGPGSGSAPVDAALPVSPRCRLPYRLP